MSLIKNITKDKLKVEIYETRAEMGRVAGKEIAKKIRELLKEKSELNIIFAAAPSQNESLAELICEKDIEWEKINAFHMDEYVGLEKTAPQGFGNFLKCAIFGKLPFKTVNYIDGCASNINFECERYTKLLKQHPIDIVCLGIGENGHIAFNDPWVADFNDAFTIKKVPLDEICRNQQVNDGCFAKIDDVPKYALTLTIPTLFSADYLFCVVPAKTKANAVKNTVFSQISIDCPASIMRKHDNAVMYCDSDSGKYLM